MAQEEFISVMDGLLLDQAVQVLDARLVGVVHRVNEVKSKYGKELIDAGIGTNSAPFFLTGTSWKPLGDAWLRRKNASQGSPNFYIGLTGDLHKDILAMPSERIFGRTKLTAAADVRQAQGFYNPKTGKFIQTVFRDNRGRFASSKLEGVKRFTVRIDPFPEISGNSYSSNDLINKLPIGNDSRLKLQYNKEARPLVVGFTEWFFENRIKFAIDQALKEVFK